MVNFPANTVEEIDRRGLAARKSAYGQLHESGHAFSFFVSPSHPCNILASYKEVIATGGSYDPESVDAAEFISLVVFPVL